METKIESKKITESWTMRFNAALALIGGVLEFLPDILEAAASPEVADSMRSLVGGAWYGKMLAVAVIGNVILRKRTKGPVQ